MADQRGWPHEMLFRLDMLADRCRTLGEKQPSFVPRMRTADLRSSIEQVAKMLERRALSEKKKITLRIFVEALQEQQITDRKGELVTADTRPVRDVWRTMPQALKNKGKPKLEREAKG